MRYIRVTEGFTKPQFIPETKDIQSVIKNRKSDWYYSTYLFNEEHKKHFDKTKSVKGIRDVVSNALWWDIDAEGDYNLAKETTQTIIKRLMDRGFPENTIQIRFSGSKGFHIWIDIDREYNTEEMTNIASELSKGLPGFDTSMYDATQLLRVPLTHHNKTDAYCIPITLDELNTLTETDMRSNAGDISTIDASVVSSYYQKATVPQEVDNYKYIKVKEEKVNEELLSFNVSDIDFIKKPSFLSNALWALQLGYFRGSEAAAETGDVGERHHAFLCLAANYRKKGFDKITTYHLLKGVAELQASRTGEDKYDKEKLWIEVVESVYDDGWNGGKHQVWLEEKYVKHYDIPKVEYYSGVKRVNIGSGFEEFLEYAKDIDKYRFEFGIPELDRKMRARTGYLIGMLAPPGMGKCLKNGTEVIMFDGSIKKIEDIKVGDTLMGPDSTKRTVLKTCFGKDKTYKITPIKGESFSCIGSHILSLKCSVTKNKRFIKDNIYNISVNEYLDLPKSIREKLKLWRTGFDFKAQDTNFDPYLMGFWLGDGTRGKPQITCGDYIEMDSYFNTIAEKNNFYLNKTKDKGDCYNYYFASKKGKGGSSGNKFLNEVRNFVKDDQKYIPKNYLLNSRQNRLKLLAGLLDSDGYLTNKTFEIVTKFDYLKDDILYLVRSLGFGVNRADKVVNGQLYHRITIFGDVNLIPTKIKRNQAKPRLLNKSVLVTGFSIEEEGINDYSGIELDKDSLYLLKDTTVTHNTSFAITAINNTSKAGRRSLVFSYDMAQSVLFQKLIQRETGLDEDTVFNTIKAFYAGNERAKYKVKQWASLLSENYDNVEFVFKSGQSIPEIKQTIMETELAIGENIPFVVIDYSELVHSQFSDPTQASAEVIQGLREICNEMNKCVLVLLQPNKTNSKPNEPLLTYNCAKGSSAIAQAVTMMITAHRPGYSSTNPENDRFFSINCVKNRMGALFSVDFSWEGSTGKIGEIDPHERGFLEQLRDMNKEEAKKTLRDF